MSRLTVETRGIGTWRECLASPETQWKQGYSAFETAVSWELASRTYSGLPTPIERLFQEDGYPDPVLAFAVAEHKVQLDNEKAASQCDVWAVVKTLKGFVSLTVEAKAKEAFGDHTLADWLVAGGTNESKRSREERWNFIRPHLPQSGSFLKVRYQLLHRCAASVIEAKRLGYQHAAMIIQAFETPDSSFQEYARFCQALKILAVRGTMASTSVGGISLSVGWADCPLASDAQVAATA